jgi:hypothetical protein
VICFENSLGAYQIVCIVLFAAVFIILCVIDAEYGDMSMFKGTPPFRSGDPGQTFYDTLNSPFIWTWIGAFIEILQLIRKKQGRKKVWKERDFMLFALISSAVSLCSIIYYGVRMDSSLYTINDSGAAKSRQCFEGGRII